MAVELIKVGARIYDGLQIYPDKVLCDLCYQSYELHYSNGEEHRLKDWLAKAQQAVNNSHANNHPDTVCL
jgi:hypothetical protein